MKNKTRNELKQALKDIFEIVNQHKGTDREKLNEVREIAVDFLVEFENVEKEVTKDD